MLLFLRRRFFPFLIRTGLIVVIISTGCQDPPDAAMEKAHGALLKARQNDARKLAGDTYRLAEEIFHEGQLEVARQNGWLAPLRDYTRADSLFNQAYLAARKASAAAVEKLQQMKTEAKSQKKAFRDELDAWREALDGTLTLYRAERYWSSANLSMEVSERLFAEGQFEEVTREVNRGKESLVRLAAVVEENAGDESRKIEMWRRWVDSTVSISRRTGSIAVIVDKSKHRLYLLSGGKIIQTFSCDLGYNSIHQKMVSGDGATPEGIYKVTKVKSSGSKYYKALLLNYPNEQDKKRFASNKAHGIISEEARIGGLIEIHGEGGRNKDWTEGCVALANKDMDELMKYVKLGTAVTIVRKSDRWP